jgi:hypothetical protein
MKNKVADANKRLENAKNYTETSTTFKSIGEFKKELGFYLDFYLTFY